MFVVIYDVIRQSDVGKCLKVGVGGVLCGPKGGSAGARYMGSDLAVSSSCPILSAGQGSSRSDATFCTS